MSDTLRSSRLEQTLSLSELTAISLDAAIQLDRILHGSTPNSLPLRKLSDILRGASALPSGATALSLHCSPSALRILSRALADSAGGPLSTVTDLTNQISDYVTMLSKNPETWAPEAIRRSLSFCLSLHRELIAEISQPEVIVPSDDWTGEASWTS
jgi:hypothetical protein